MCPWQGRNGKLLLLLLCFVSFILYIALQMIKELNLFVSMHFANEHSVKTMYSSLSQHGDSHLQIYNQQIKCRRTAGGRTSTETQRRMCQLHRNPVVQQVWIQNCLTVRCNPLLHCTTLSGHSNFKLVFITAHFQEQKISNTEHILHRGVVVCIYTEREMCCI